MSKTIEIASAPTPTPAAAPASPDRLRERVPFNTPQLQLDHPEIPGYHLAWVDEHQMESAMRGGYECVEEPTSGDPVDRQGGADITGRKRRLVGMQPFDLTKPRYQWLMKIPLDLHEQDLNVIRRRGEALQDVLTRRNMPDNIGPSEKSRFYHPKT